VFPLTFFHPSRTVPSTQALHAPHFISLTSSAEVIHGNRGIAEDVPVPWKMKYWSVSGGMADMARERVERRWWLIY
jgi:hypothetical protein